MKTKLKKNTVKGVKAYGILNRLGQFWTTNAFQSEQDAKNYIEKFWRGTSLTDLEQFKVIEVKITPIKKVVKK